MRPVHYIAKLICGDSPTERSGRPNCDKRDIEESLEMFEALRKMILPIIIIVLVFFMGMIVLEWGLDFTQRGNRAEINVAGVINGQEVSWDYFGQIFDRFYQRETENNEEELPDSRIRELRTAAWNEIVGDILLQQEAEKRGITISDQDIYISLRTNPPPYLQQSADFQTDGRFDYQKYLNIMADPQAAFFWAALEPQVRKELKRIRVQQLVVQAPHVTEAEVKQAYMDANEKVEVMLVNVQMGDFSKEIGQPDDSILKVYFEENRDKYDIEERRVLSIVKFEKLASDEDDARALAQITVLYDSAAAGADFAELAKNWSQDEGTAPKGGDLGWVYKGRMVPEFDSVSFAMSEGQISTPVKTMFGYHIIKNEGFKDHESPDGTISKQAKLAHLLIRTQPSQETLARGLGKMDTVLARTLATDMETAAEGLGVELHKTDPLLDGNRIPYLGNSSSHHILEWAFKAEAGDVSEVMENDDTYSVVRVDEIIPAGPAEFEAVRNRVMSDYRYTTAQQLCRDTMAAVYAEIQGGLSLDNAAYRHHLEQDYPAMFARTSTVPDLVNDPAAIGAAFSLKEKGEILGPLDYKGGTVIMQLISRVEPDLAQYNEQRDSIYNTLLSAKQQKTWELWFRALHDNSEIENNVITQRARRMY